MSRRPRVFLVGYYGMHNLGDEAIRTAIERAAERRGVDVTSFASRDPDESDPRGVPVRGIGVLRYVAAILRADRVVLGGGGVLKDEGKRLPLELAATAIAARLARKRLTLLAVGVGPFYTGLGRRLAQLTARLAHVRTVRDEASGAALRALRVGRVEVGADPTFDMVPSSTAAQAVPSSSTSVARHSPPPRRVVVSLRPWYLQDPDGGAARQAALREAVAGALEPLASDGWRIDALSLYWPRDRAEAAALADDPRIGGSVSIIHRELDWDGLLDTLRDADLVLAMRYHAAAASTSLGRPTVVLAYEPKVRSLREEVGLPGVDVDDPRGMASRLAEHVVAAVADPTTACPDPAAVERLRQRATFALDRALTG